MALMKLWLFLPLCLFAAEQYPLGPDSHPQAGVPKGTVTQHTWTSKIFPGTTRDYWVYVPAQYKHRAACGGDDLPGWRRNDQRDRPLARADRVRQPDP